MSRTGKVATPEELRSHLAAIVDSSDDAILSKDLDGIITSWNAGAERLYGYTAREAIGRPISMLVPEEHGEEIPAIMERLRRGERVDHYETIRQAKDGRRLNISLTVSPIRDAKGTIVGASAVGRDITARVRTEAIRSEIEQRRHYQNERFETLLNRAPLGAYLVDAEFRLQQTNPIAEPVFAGLPDGGIGQDFEQILHILWRRDRAEEIVRVFRHTLETGEPYHVPEFAERRLDLDVVEYYDWRIERIMLPDGNYGVVCYFQDISDQVNARLALTESEARYRTLFDSIDEGFCILEVIFDAADNPIDYRYIETNPAFAAQTGLEDVIGRSIRELVPDIEPFWFDIYGKVALTGEPTRFIDHAESMGRWFDVNAFRIGDPNERRVAILFTDITERKRSEAELVELTAEIDRQWRLYDTIISSTPDLVYVFDLDYRFTFVNKALLETWGRTLEESIGKRLIELGYEPWHAEMHEREIDQVVATKEPIRGEVAFPHATLGTRIYDYIFAPVLNEAGDVESVAGTTRDVTERKRAEQKLEETDRRKDEFLATLAHELRNPLGAIRSAMSVLQDAADDPLRVTKMTEIIERQSSQLVRLIDDLLDVSRISLGRVQLEREPIDVAEIVRQVVSDSLGMCEQEGLNLSAAVPEVPIMVDADAVRFAQVLNNLIHNACKFTPSGGEIRVTLERDGREAVTRVTDTGIGMSPEQCTRIFERFTQAGGSLDRPGDGLGIGLSLARSIVELHGGTIGARSEGPGKGSDFFVRLPVSDDEGQGRDAPAIEVAGERSEEPEKPVRPEVARRIVAAEDNGDALYAVALILRAKGHEVETAVDGVEALEKVREKRPDAALLDIGMPRMDGYEVARQIRREPWGKDIFLIALTGWGQEKDKRLAMEAGFDRHLTKPVDPRVLHELLRAGTD